MVCPTGDVSHLTSAPLPTQPAKVLIARVDRPDAVKSSFKPRVSEQKFQEASGRKWQDWFAALDKHGAARRPHTEIAR